MAVAKIEAPVIQPNAYYTIEEAAALLRVPTSSIRRLLDERPIGVKIGRHWRILGAGLLSLTAPQEETEAEQLAFWREASRSTLQELWDNEEDAVYDRL